MGTQIFDDGSTITTDENGAIVSSSDSPYAFTIDSADASKINSYIPGNQSSPWWNRVFDYSIPRAIDSAIASKEAASNRGRLYIAGANGLTVPAGVQPFAGIGQGGIMWLLLGGLLIFVLSGK